MSHAETLASIWKLRLHVALIVGGVALLMLMASTSTAKPVPLNLDPFLTLLDWIAAPILLFGFVKLALRIGRTGLLQLALLPLYGFFFYRKHFKRMHHKGGH